MLGSRQGLGALGCCAFPCSPAWGHAVPTHFASGCACMNARMSECQFDTQCAPGKMSRWGSQQAAPGTMCARLHSALVLGAVICWVLSHWELAGWVDMHWVQLV